MLSTNLCKIEIWVVNRKTSLLRGCKIHITKEWNITTFTYSQPSQPQTSDKKYKNILIHNGDYYFLFSYLTGRNFPPRDDFFKDADEK
jgi:hypothetical protein